MSKHGGKRPGAGRKTKADELVLIERLTPLADSAFEALKRGLGEGNPQYVKLWFEYMYGKPNQKIDFDATVSGIKQLVFESASQKDTDK